MQLPQQCSIDGCGGAVLARGWCSRHYDRWRRTGNPISTVVRECVEDGCGRPTVGQGWCETHYSRFVRVPRRQARMLEAKTNRKCEHCGQPIPIQRNAKASYCSSKCKRKGYDADGRGRIAALRSHYKKTYGLTLERVEAMRLDGCQICGATNGGGRHGQLHIDHDHKTGRIRGMLCHGCNTGLGAFRDDPNLLRRAATYLE